MKDAPAFSIVIPVFNKWDLTEQCLRALAETTPEYDFEVIVVDNGSADVTTSRSQPRGEALFGPRFLRIRFEENRNFSPACNAGARAATAPLLFFLNNDTLPTPGWAQVLLLYAKGPGGRSAPERAYMLCRELLARERSPEPEAAEKSSDSGADSLEILAAASAFALIRGDFRLARVFWGRFSGRGKAKPPGSPAELCFSLSAAFRRRAEIFDSGFRFDPDKGILPESALAWLQFARSQDPACRDAAVGHMHSLLVEKTSLHFLAVGYLAEHCLAEPDNWRVQLEYGLACLKACRVREGLCEIVAAREKARSSTCCPVSMTSPTAASPSPPWTSGRPRCTICAS